MIWYFAPLLFLAGIVTDVTWALYIQALADRKRLPAALYSVGTGVVSIVFVEGMIHDPVLSVFWLVGLFFGTFYASSIQQFVKGLWNAHRKNRKV